MAGIATNAGSVLSKVNDTVNLSVTLVKNGLPLSGKTPKVRFIRCSDNKFYNFGLNVWQTPIYSKTLVEMTVASGVYTAVFDQSVADLDTEEDYLAVFTANGVPADTFYGTVDYSFKRFALPGDEMTVSAASISAIRLAIWQHVVDGNILGLTAEETVDMSRKILNNNLNLSDGTGPLNWVLLDDDDITPFLSWTVLDKSGAQIIQPTLFPSRRTRGV